MNSKESTIASYINTLTPPLEREDIYREMVKQDSTITRGTISKVMREMGYKPIRMRGGDTPSGICQRWVLHETDTDETKPEKTEADESPEIRRVMNTCANLTDENMRLVELVQKSVKLRKEIREQQKQLLLEMSQLVQVMYGGEDEES